MDTTIVVNLLWAHLEIIIGETIENGIEGYRDLKKIKRARYK